jgi:hypothetical protein
MRAEVWLVSTWHLIYMKVRLWVVHDG